MDQVHIDIEENQPSSIKGYYEKVASLKVSQQLTLFQVESFGEKKKAIFELREAIKNGKVDNFVHVLEKVCRERQLALSAIFNQVTPSHDSLLHEAAYFGKAEIAQLIGHHFPQLLTSTNIDGDTPLHIAARLKRSSMIKAILSQYHEQVQISSNSSTEGKKIITQVTNEYGNTALHEAVSSKYVEGVNLLLEEDKSVVHLLNKSKISALYLAVLTSDKQIVNAFLEALPEAPFPDEKCQGISPLHAAIHTKNRELLKEIADKISNSMFLRDEDGGTPLHYAAAIGYVEGVRELLKKSFQPALEWNIKGHLPIHLAAKHCHIDVLMEMFRQGCDDSRVFLNKKGRNILHIAAKCDKRKVVKCVLENIKFKSVAINKKDIHGNTPLHLAAIRHLNPFIVYHLTQVKGIDLNIVNNEGLTPRDLVSVKSKILVNKEGLTQDHVLVRSEMRVNKEGLTQDHVLERSEILMTGEQETANLILELAGAKNSAKGKAMLIKSKSQHDTGKWMQDRLNILMVVAILIVTVTFTAGFTVPGGSYSSDDQDPSNRGMAVLGHKPLFKMFVVLDTVAMYSSTFGSYILLGIMLGKFKFVQVYGLALFMVCLSLLLMILAFMAAASLVVSNIRWLASFIIYLGIVSFYCISSSSNPYMFFLIFFGLRLYWVKSFKLLSGLFNQRGKHQSSDYEQAQEDESVRCKPKFLLRYF